MRNYHKLELEPKEIENITNHLNKYYPELMKSKNNLKWDTGIYINLIGYFVKSNIDIIKTVFHPEWGNWGSLSDLISYSNEHRIKCLNIDISKLYLTDSYISSCRPGWNHQKTDVYNDNLSQKKYSSLVGIHDACSYLKKGQKAIFPRYLFGNNGIFGQIEIENKYLKSEDAKRFIKKLNKDDFLKGYINKYYQQYGEFKDHLQENQSKAQEETLEK